MRAYRLYGLCLASDWPLPYREEPGPRSVDVELLSASASDFARVRHRPSPPPPTNGFFHLDRLDDGTFHLHWSGLFEFLVEPDGRRVLGRALTDVPSESFQNYLLGQVLSFALLRRGIEALLSTAVVVNGAVVAFLGDSGFGKSTLGASFVSAGHRILTDDVLVMRRDNGGFCAFPGPPRIKLFPETASVMFGDDVEGTRMDNRTPKLILPLTDEQVADQPLPVKAMYVLPPPGAPSVGSRVAIRRLSRSAAFMRLLENTFNVKLVEPDRLQGQFEFTGAVADVVPVSSLMYTKRLDLLPAVRDAILADLVRC